MSLNSLGSLVVVGFGIKFLSHLTTETKTYITNADKVIYLLNEPVAKEWIKQNSKSFESLDELYQQYSSRSESYQAISDYSLRLLKEGMNVCLVLYGHPTVYAQPGIQAVIKARENGYNARILPAISSEACLFADLLVDPGSCGYQSYEATDFLINHRHFNPSSHLVILQIGFIGALSHPIAYDNSPGIKKLYDKLATSYSPEHEVTIYEAAQYPHFRPRVEKFPLHDLIRISTSNISTLYLPPREHKQYDSEMLSIINSSHKTY